MGTAPTLPTTAPAVKVTRHASVLGSWEIADRAPHPLLTGLFDGYGGYREDSTVIIRRRQVALDAIVLIISFGDRIRLLPQPGLDAPAEAVSFVAGLHNGPAVTEHTGLQAGVQINLTPLGAYTLLGLPMSAIADRIIPFEDLTGRTDAAGLARDLPERLAYAPTWADRFALLDDVWLRRLADGPAPRPEVTRCWDLLRASTGRLTVTELADETGWSRRHLTARFREQVGLPPKSVARLLRFQEAVRRLDTPGRPVDLAALADRCGFYDQAHLNRDFRELAGCTPTTYVAARRPDGLGVGA